MKKLLLTIFIVFCAFITFAQPVQNLGSKTSRVNVLGSFSVDSASYLPLKDTTWSPYRRGTITMRPQDSLLYFWNARKWINLGSPNLIAGFGINIVGTTIQADSAKLASFLRLYKTIDSLVARADTFSFYRIPGIDSIYYTINDQIAAVKDSTGSDEIQYEGVTLSPHPNVIDFLGTGVVMTQSNDTIHFSFEGGSGGTLTNDRYVTGFSIDPTGTGIITLPRSEGLPTLSQTINTSLVPELGNLYYTNPRARLAISATSPIFYDNITGIITSQFASPSLSGVISSSTYNLFNAKQGAIQWQKSGTNVGSVGGISTVNVIGNQVTMSGASSTLTLTVADQTAGNGLYKSGNEFRLGGTITESTDLNLGSNFFSVLGDSVQMTVEPLIGHIQFGGSANAEMGVQRIGNKHVRAFMNVSSSTVPNIDGTLYMRSGLKYANSGGTITSANADSSVVFDLSLIGTNNGNQKISGLKIDPVAVWLLGRDSVVVASTAIGGRSKLVYSVYVPINTPYQVPHKFYVDSLNNLNHRKIQWQNSGVNLGAAGDATIVNVIGGASASIIGNTVTLTASGGTSPGGTNTQFQFNNSGTFGGTSTIGYDNSTGVTTFSPSGALNSMSITNVGTSAGISWSSGPFTMSVGNSTGALSLNAAGGSPELSVSTSSVNVIGGTTLSISDLAGSGTRMLTVNNTGSVGATTLPTNGEVNTASNIGGGNGLFFNKVGVDLRFRTIKGGGGNSIITDVDEALIIQAPSFVNVGTGSNVFKELSGNNVRFRKLNAGTGVSITENTDDISIANTAPDQVVSIAGTGGISVTGTYPSFSVSGSGIGGVLAERTTIANSTFYQFCYAATPGSGIINSVLRVGSSVGDPTLKTMTIDAVLYVSNTNATIGSWVNIGQVPVNYRPNNTVFFAMPLRVDGTQFTNSGATGFTGSATYTEATGRVLADGSIDVYISGPSYATLGGVSYAILPIHVTYFYVSGS